MYPPCLRNERGDRRAEPSPKDTKEDKGQRLDEAKGRRRCRLVALKRRQSNPVGRDPLRGFTSPWGQLLLPTHTLCLVYHKTRRNRKTGNRSSEQHSATTNSIARQFSFRPPTLNLVFVVLLQLKLAFFSITQLAITIKPNY